jgi:hypothetical protein
MKKLVYIFCILVAIDLLLFGGMVITAMTDEASPPIGQKFYWALKYVMGFPLVLVNSNFSFFLDNLQIPYISIVLIILNNDILAYCILYVRKILK